ncbi:ABC transporter ATP-binding protein [Paenibacillus tritici]|uniref:ABC transporter ATP-binding protein n=1 Tax=Paenibacillus tritici TaxID=1873425 RepID=UPI001BA79207|nr:ABC transporter ATP-binding protein [Paenibacillus tritici]QUL55911.1 ABC transporter ATP-binding protein [Paenibacillus tritici]
MSYILETGQLCKKFGAFTAVNNITVKVPALSVYGILGANGAGKTTTLKMLCGLSRPTSGSIRIDGEELQFGKPHGSRLGFVPDVPQYYKWMKPRELMLFVGNLHHKQGPSLTSRIDELLHKVGLEGCNQKIGSLSRGMKQRLGIAQALISEPTILVLDEPTSALDPIGRSEVMDLIRSLAGELTVLLSSHNLHDVEEICDRILMMDQGRVIADDSLLSIKSQFALNTLELQTEDMYLLQSAASLLSGHSEVLEVEVLEDKQSLSISVANLRTAQIYIPSMMSSAGIPLSLFKVTEPTLEQFFLKMVTAR